MRVEVVPSRFPGVAQIARHVRDAAAHVGLEDDLESIGLVLDAPEFEGSGFWQLETSKEAVARAVLYGSPEDLLVADRRRSGSSDPELLAGLDDAALDVLRLDRWLHRNLLQLDDLRRRRVRPEEIDSKDGEGLQACWDVWTDGRLRAWQHPGLSQAERRRLFYRVFAARAVLVPKHWQVFHELWEGGLAEHEGLLQAIRRLPTP